MASRANMACGKRCRTKGDQIVVELPPDCTTEELTAVLQILRTQLSRAEISACPADKHLICSIQFRKSKDPQGGQEAITQQVRRIVRTVVQQHREEVARRARAKARAATATPPP